MIFIIVLSDLLVWAYIIWYLTIIPRERIGYEMVDIQRCASYHLISNKREWNNCFIKTTTKYRKIYIAISFLYKQQNDDVLATSGLSIL